MHIRYKFAKKTFLGLSPLGFTNEILKIPWPSSGMLERRY
jgi:hypothetical protein